MTALIFTFASIMCSEGITLFTLRHAVRAVELRGPCSGEDKVGVFVDYFCGCAGCVRMDDHAMTLLLLEI